MLLALQLHFLRLAMGSVGADFQCPWCGRRHMGGYSVDSVGYPLCTLGRYNCVSKAISNPPISTRAEYLVPVMKWILCLPDDSQFAQLLPRITQYIGSKTSTTC